MATKLNIILTCIGGYGALTLLEDFLRSEISKKINFIGTHSDPVFLARSPLKVNYLVPSALKDTNSYIESTKRIIAKEHIDLIIPKSDAEVKAVYPILGELSCKTFLPDSKEIDSTQDKLDFFQILKNANVPAPQTFQIKSLKEIALIMNKLKKVQNRYWLRVKTAGTAGAYGATWVTNDKEAAEWVINFCKKESIDLSEFTLSEFLPGRLFECLVLFKKGNLKLAKIYENLRFANGGDPQNDGVGSTPDLAKSISDDVSKRAMENAIRAVKSASHSCGSLPNGIYHMSAKQNHSGEPCITEVNIGRAPSTISIFNRIGEYNVAEYFLNYALDQEIEDPDPTMDIPSETVFAIRSLDQPLCIRSESQMNAARNIIQGNDESH